MDWRMTAMRSHVRPRMAMVRPIFHATGVLGRNQIMGRAKGPMQARARTMLAVRKYHGPVCPGGAGGGGGRSGREGGGIPVLEGEDGGCRDDHGGHDGQVLDVLHFGFPLPLAEFLEGDVPGPQNDPRQQQGEKISAAI